MALCSLVSGYHLIETRRLGLRKAIPVLVVLLLQVFLVQMTRSATGLLVLLASGGLFALANLWHRMRHRLRRPHYLIALGTAVTALVIFGLRIREVLALLGRNTALSGRIPLWQHVLAEYVSERPILGYGLGAFWDSLSIRVATAQAIGSRLRIEIGDNGWLDVLLGVGGIGLALFLLVQLVMLQRGIQRMKRGRGSTDSLPLTFLLAALLANLAFSLFLETESGVWLMLVALHFLPVPTGEVSPRSSQATHA
jgi:exopolysaccharide production protein ExoQ